MSTSITQVPFVTILQAFSASFIFGFLYRYVLRIIAMNRKKNGTNAWSNRLRSANIGVTDRGIRLVCGVVLFILAAVNMWNPLTLFFSGFCFFEAIFSWCGFYAALGKNTCPIE